MHYFDHIFFSQNMNIFIEAPNKKFWGKSVFVIKQDRIFFWRIADTC